MSGKFLHIRRWLRGGFLQRTSMQRTSLHSSVHICPLPPSQPAAFPSDLLRPSPNYRGTSGLPVSLIFRNLFKKKTKKKKQIKKKKTKTRTFLRTMPQWKEHRPSILRPKFAKNLELGFLFCLVLFCLNQTTTSFKIFTRSNYSVPKHQTCTAHGPHGKAPSAGQPQMLP